MGHFGVEQGQPRASALLRRDCAKGLPRYSLLGGVLRQRSDVARARSKKIGGRYSRQVGKTVAALCERRNRNRPAVIDRRYNIRDRIVDLVCLRQRGGMSLQETRC